MDTFITWFTFAVVYGTILSISACGEIINEKAGHLNLGIPGIMYLSGVVSYIATKAYEGAVEEPLVIVIILLAVLSSLLTGALFGLLYSVFAVTFRCNQNVLGLSIAAFGVGFGKFLSLVIGAGSTTYPKLAHANDIFNAGLPFLKDLGVVGDLFFNYGFMTYVVVILLVVAMIFFRKTRIGLNLRSIGESPATADAVGLNVSRYKYIATMIGCSLAGFGGMIYVMQFSGASWSTNNSIEALGWLAVALVIFVSWKPIHLLWGAPLFGFLFWAYAYLPNMLSINGFTGMTQVIQMLPYLVTIIVLIINSSRKKKENQPPASLGLPYFREER